MSDAKIVDGVSSLTVATVGEAMLVRKFSVYRDPEFLELVDLIKKSDVGFVNLEGLPGNFKGYPYSNFGGTPSSFDSSLVQELGWTGFNLVSIANNHAMDCGPDNLFSAIESLDEAGITYAGAGKDLDWARMPGYLETSKGLVALVASTTSDQETTSYQQHTRASKPGGGYIGRPGVNGIRTDHYYTVDEEAWQNLLNLKSKFSAYFQKEDKLESQRIHRDDSKNELLLLGTRFVLDNKISIRWLVNESDLEANIKRVSDANKLADWVLASNHCHESIPDGQGETLPPEHIVKYAHDCIDNGAEAYFGHGVHNGQGLEIYKDRPIFYSLATPIYSAMGVRRIPLEIYERYSLGQDATPSDFFSVRDQKTRADDTYLKWLQTLLAVFTLTGRKGSRKLSELKLYPISSFKSGPQMGVRPVIVKDEILAREIINRYSKLSSHFGTKIEFNNGIGQLEL